MGLLNHRSMSTELSPFY